MMAANNMNEMPIFQTVDTNSMEDSGQIFSQPLPVQTAASEAISLPAPTPIENVTTVTPTTPGTNTSSGMSLHSILMSNSNIPSPSPSTSFPVVSASQNHIPQATPATGQATARAAQSVTSNQTNAVNHDQVLTKTRLQDLVKEIDPCEQLDEEVEDLLLQLVDDFVNSTVNTACVFAKHRNASTVEVKDVQLYLEKTYNMWIPGFGTEEVKPYKKPPITEAHKQRLALIRKSLKKY